jgi:hypothetical protein
VDILSSGQFLCVRLLRKKRNLTVRQIGCLQKEKKLSEVVEMINEAKAKHNLF